MSGKDDPPGLLSLVQTLLSQRTYQVNLITNIMIINLVWRQGYDKILEATRVPPKTIAELAY